MEPNKIKDKPIEEMSYEEALSELEALSNKMSQGGLTLDESVQTYQRGVELGAHCQKLLDTAQKKIQKLDAQLTDITKQDLREDIPF